MRALQWILGILIVVVLAECSYFFFFMHGEGQGGSGIRGGHPVGIVIHHTTSGPYSGGRLVDVAFINAGHKRRHFIPVFSKNGKAYYVGYHYVILQDGTIQQGRPENSPGSHAKGHPNMLGIVLVGNFDNRSNTHGQYGPLIPPPAQLAAAERLTQHLMRKYHLSLRQVYLHRDLRATACPGNCFPRLAFYRAIAQP